MLHKLFVGYVRCDVHALHLRAVVKIYYVVCMDVVGLPCQVNTSGESLS